MFDVSFPPGVTPDSTQLAISPDGRYLAVSPTFEGRAPIWLRPVDSTAWRMLPGTEGASFPFWSPDGKSIGFFADRKLKRIDLDGEAVLIVTDVRVARGGMWQPDGTILFAPNATGPLFRVSASGGTALIATQSSWHSSGGVPFRDAADLTGRVLGHKGLYVLDGARIPGSTGACNPSMTIAALAEHSMRTIVRQDLGRVF